MKKFKTSLVETWVYSEVNGMKGILIKSSYSRKTSQIKYNPGQNI